MELWREAESRLTPAAREMLDELLDDIRRQTLLTADRRAYGGEISVRDVVEAFQRKGTRAYTPRVERTLRLSALIAAGYAVVGALAVAFGVFFAKHNDLASGTSTVVILSGASAITAAVGILVSARLRVRNVRRDELIEERADLESNTFLSVWVATESKLRLLAARLLGESSSEQPFSQLVDVLEKAEFLEVDKADELRDLAHIRNQLVHGGMIDERLMNDAIRRLSKLSSTIDRLANRK